jgi:hypothetical protein
LQGETFDVHLPQNVLIAAEEKSPANPVISLKHLKTQFCTVTKQNIKNSSDDDVEVERHAV